MNPNPLLRPAMWVLLVLMPVVTVLSFRSGDLLLSAMTATFALFAAFTLRYGTPPPAGAPRAVGTVLALLMVTLGMAQLLT